MKIKYISLILTASLALYACDSDIDALSDPVNNEVVEGNPDIQYSSGSADFSTFVSVGNSLTAGYSDNALFAMGQEVSFPNLLAGQFALAGGGDFTQPYMNDDIGGLLLGGNPIASPRMFFDIATQTPSVVSGTPSTEVSNILNGPFNNMGVPGAKTYHLVAPGYGNLANLAVGAANPYFVRMATSPNTTVIADAMAMNPTFFSLWIGNNDVLGYAASGGSGTDHNVTGNLDPSTYASNDITNSNVFAQVYNGLVQTMVSGGAEGVIMNIPDVTSTPYFNTVPYAPLDPTNPDFGPQIPTLNMIFGALNGVFTALGEPERAIIFNENAASAIVIKDENLTDISASIEFALNSSPTFPAFIGQFGLPPEAAPLIANILGQQYGQCRQATAEDLVVLTSSSVIGTPNMASATALATQLINNGIPAASAQQLAGMFSLEGITYAMDDQWVLLPEEQEDVNNAISAFNNIIENAAMTNDLAFFDVNSFFTEVANTGYQAGSAFMTADYVTGGTFSLDGIHPSPRGYSVIANKILEVINAKYGSNIQGVNPVDFTGVYIQ
ncbi:G-D-S-L family lipolytic protein [Mangrovimonas sp. CR14]|uniref:SGNH/GDSL hydrolase family protein n=1 Tax=Mangrovimonas sp. CR14 TaxID=2706120 RepID=UPI0014205B96|nr:SGNH/GDSL hydrolase family protein [Mangrovimonas sp. CR14]NIK91073.1 G-D-S-L family lipolytic protein [Mangrovimonas sp. CR14]